MMDMTAVKAANTERRPRLVSAGVYRLIMPLPFELNHINLYLLEDEDGWVLVDCGLDNADTRAAWEEVLSGEFFQKPITRIVVTHFHPDHIGLADWLQKRTAAQVCISRGEYEAARTAMGEGVDSRSKRDRFSAFGLSGDELDIFMRTGLQYSRLVKSLPDNVTFMEEGDEVIAGNARWKVVVGRGHSPEQACLFNPSSRVLITGDHVLPTITPNISLTASSSDNPLNDYLCTLEQIGELGAALYLPAHGQPASDLNVRIRALVDHHRSELRGLQSCMAHPKTVRQCAKDMFGEFSPGQLGFALGEAAAHLVYLEEEGVLDKTVVDGCWVFERASDGYAQAGPVGD